MPDLLPRVSLDLDRPGLLYESDQLAAGYVALAWRSGSGEWPAPGERADAAGPLVWLRTEASRSGDGFIRLAVAAGLPLGTAVDSETFLACKPKSLLDNHHVVALPAAGAPEVPRLLALLEAGAQILFHGPVTHADPDILACLGLRVGRPIEGPCLLDGQGLAGGPIFHDSEAAGGPITAEAVGSETVVSATVSSGNEVRAYAVRSGSAAWVHGSGPQPDGSSAPARLGLALLANLGLAAQTDRGPLVWWRSDNALRVVAAAGGEVGLALPDGAPIPTGSPARIENGVARVELQADQVAEARACVRQSEGEVLCEELPPRAGRTGALRLSGLQDAVVVVRPPVSKVETAVVSGTDAVFADERLGVVVAFGVSGSLKVTW